MKDASFIKAVYRVKGMFIAFCDWSAPGKGSNSIATLWRAGATVREIEFQEGE